MSHASAGLEVLIYSGDHDTGAILLSCLSDLAFVNYIIAWECYLFCCSRRIVSHKPDGQRAARTCGEG